MVLGSAGRTWPPGPVAPLVFKAAASQILHHGERHSLKGADVRDLDDVRMREPDERANFAGEPAGEIGVVHHRLARNLDDDLGIDVLIEGAVDEPHSALAELGGDSVAPAGELRPFPCLESDRHETPLRPSIETISPDGSLARRPSRALLARPASGGFNPRNWLNKIDDDPGAVYPSLTA